MKICMTEQLQVERNKISDSMSIIKKSVKTKVAFFVAFLMSKINRMTRSFFVR